MGDWPRLVNLRRCARGNMPAYTTDTNATTVLYNNSLGPELILVWQVQVVGSDSGSAQFSYQQGLQPTIAGFVEPLVPGDAIPPGLLGGADVPTTFPYSWLLAKSELLPQWPATFPFAVLQPGWSLVIQNTGTDDTGTQVNLFWEAILSKYFDRVHTMAQIELDILAEST